MSEGHIVNFFFVIAVPVAAVVIGVLILTVTIEPCAGCRRRPLLRRRLPFNLAVGCACELRTEKRPRQR
jgi:hypothetical protein